MQCHRMFCDWGDFQASEELRHRRRARKAVLLALPPSSPESPMWELCSRFPPSRCSGARGQCASQHGCSINPRPRQEPPRHLEGNCGLSGPRGAYSARWAKLEGLPCTGTFTQKPARYMHSNMRLMPGCKCVARPRGEPAPEMEHSQRAAECLKRKLVATLRAVVGSRSSLQSDSAGVGAIDLLPGGDRIRVFF